MNATSLKRPVFLAFFFIFAFSSAALAQSTGGGLSSVNTLMQTLTAALNGISVAVCILSIIWCGYKFMFLHAQFMDLVPIIAGALLIAGASQIANMILSNLSSS